MGYHCGWIEVHAVDHCNLTCASCHNSSPFAPPREYSASDYFPWLDILVSKNIAFHKISIMGGEPFIHFRLIEFADDLKARYPEKKLIISTNGFWLSKDNIQRYSNLWKILYSIKFSLYPTVLRKVGGIEKVEKLLDALRKHNPNVEVQIIKKSHFVTLEFYSQKHPVERYCGNADCIALLADGRMARCGAGGFSRFNPYATDEFKNSPHMFYDLKKFNADSFWLWRNRFPLDACEYCSIVRAQSHEWKKQKHLKRLKAIEK